MASDALWHIGRIIDHLAELEISRPAVLAQNGLVPFSDNSLNETAWVCLKQWLERQGCEREIWARGRRAGSSADINIPSVFWRDDGWLVPSTDSISITDRDDLTARPTRPHKGGGRMLASDTVDYDANSFFNVRFYREEYFAALGIASDKVDAVAPIQKKRGPAPVTTEKVKSYMLRDLEGGTITVADLEGGLSQEHLAEMYGTSRETIRKARKDALSEFRRNMISDDFRRNSQQRKAAQ